MPNWKKVITSGSNAHLNQITASGNISSSGTIIAEQITSKDDMTVSDDLSVGSDIIFSTNGASQQNITWTQDNDKIYFDGNAIVIAVNDGDQYAFEEDEFRSSQLIDITNTTDATDASGDTGALRVEGGASIAKKVFVGTDLSVGNNITASGNISASATSTGSFGMGFFEGRVGIGDTPIDAPLEVHLGDTTQIISDRNGNGSNIVLKRSGTTRGTLSTSNTSGQEFELFSSGDLLLNASAGNQVGIGMTSPSAKLDVTGDLRVSSHITASGDISSSGTMTSNVIVNAAGGTINDSGGASSFRVKGATDDNLIFTNASGNDNIGIGQVPVAGDGKLQVTGDLNITSHITSSGNISSSGDVIAQDVFLPTGAGKVGFNTDNFIEFEEGRMKFSLNQAAGEVMRIKSTGGGTSGVVIGADDVATDPPMDGLTVIGDISSSGNAQVNQITASAFQFVGTGTAELEVQGNITASGNISASGNLISSRQFDKSTTTNNDLAQGDIIYQGGGSTTQGDIVYMKTDGEWGSAQANAASTATSLLGIALGTDPDVDGVLLRGTYTLDHDVGNNQGVPLYLSDGTAGQATVTAPSDDGDIIRIIGYNLGDDDEIWFDPDKSWVEHN